MSARWALKPLEQLATRTHEPKVMVVPLVSTRSELLDDAIEFFW